MGEDIHTRTASEVFGVPPLLVTPELRRNAKAVNFGIVYGLSAFGLAAQLGIPHGEAQRYIQGYFERYAGVKKFIDRQIEQVRRTGETRTLFGRPRPIPDINSHNPNARGFAERTAVNTPLQGTAADLIKLAMIRIDQGAPGPRLAAPPCCSRSTTSWCSKRLPKNSPKSAAWSSTPWRTPIASRCRWWSTSAPAPTGATRSTNPSPSQPPIVYNGNIHESSRLRITQAHCA